MQMETFNEIQHQLYTFAMVVAASFLIGLEQAKIHNNDDEVSSLYGTHRTFTFIGILGYILFSFSPDHTLYLGGGLALSILLSIFYYFKIQKSNDHGLTSIMLGFIVYALAPLFITQPLWLSLSVLVLVLVFSELKEQLNQFSKKIGNDEFLTLSKFIILSGIIIPILPDQQVLKFIDITPREVWIAVVVISGISYISYLLKRYVFPNSGTVLTGILGGFYSSTATTIVLSKQSKQPGSASNQFASAILFATTAMYIRLTILAFIFNLKLGLEVAPYLGIMIGICAATSYFLLKRNSGGKEKPMVESKESYNPLQLKMALVFAVLFIGLSLLTNFALDKFGTSGMNVLSWIVGFADIDPFLLNIFQGKIDVSQKVLILATLQAITSNNILKAVYAKSISQKETGKLVFLGFGIVFAASLTEIALVSIFL